MTIYKVPIIGDGKTPETAFRPDVPKGLEWNACHIDADLGYCVIEVPDRVKADLSAYPVTKVDVVAGDKSAAIEAAVAEIVAAVDAEPLAVDAKV